MLAKVSSVFSQLPLLISLKLDGGIVCGVLPSTWAEGCYGEAVAAEENQCVPSWLPASWGDSSFSC